MPGRPMSEEQKRKTRERTRTTKRYTSNSLQLVKEVTPQILFLDAKPFVFSTDELFSFISSGCIFLKRGLVVFSFIQE